MRSATEIDARIRDGFAALSAELRASEPVDDPARRAEIAQRTVALNDAMIRDEWNAAGYAPMQGLHGRPISMTLVKQLGLQERVEFSDDDMEAVG